MLKLKWIALTAVLLPTVAWCQSEPSAWAKADSIDTHNAMGQPSTLDQQYAAARQSRQHRQAQEARTAVGRARAATATDLVSGAAVYDNSGVLIGKLGDNTPAGVVVTGTSGAVAVPADAFGKNRNGLLLSLSKADFDKLASYANKH